MRDCEKNQRQSLLRHGVAVLAGVLLAACASTPPPSSPPPPPLPPPPSSPPPPSQSESDASEQQQSESSQARQRQSESEAASQPPQGQPSPPAQAGDQQAPQSEQAGAPPAPAGTGTAQDAEAEESGSQTTATGGQTGAERSRELQGEFERSLGEFDERLAREQGELETLSDKQASANAQREQQDADRGLDGGANGDRIGRAAAPLPPAGDAELPEDGTRRGPGSPGDRASLPPAPDDVPSGQNDDVVARQLREAAENETDPELREKLWEEYRQYKRNNG